MEFTQVVFKKNKKNVFLKMEKIPGKNNHNGFAKIIKNLFHDDFVFSASASGIDRWYEKNKERRPSSESEAGEQSSHEDAWFEISSLRFKNTVFKKNGKLEKYIMGYIHSNNDLEELERLISIYSDIFTKTDSWRQRGYIEKECREVFYKTELKNKIGKYRCVHNKNKYKCVDCGGSQICGHKKRKYNCPDCISSDFSGAKICEHKRMRAFCKICNSLLSILPDGF